VYKLFRVVDPFFLPSLLSEVFEFETWVKD